MKLRQNLILVFILILLLALYGLFQYSQKHRSEQQVLAKQLFSFAPESITQLSIARIGEAPSEAERVTEDLWHITEPNETITPFHAMWNRVAIHLANLMNEHTVADSPQDLSSYGLDIPALTIRAALADGNHLEMVFGDLEPSDRFRYARLNSGPLFLVSKNSFFELDRSLFDLRHRYLVENREVPLLKLDFAWIWTEAAAEKDGHPIEPGQESTAIIVERSDPQAPWRVTAPFEASAHYEKVEALAEALQFAVCKAYVDTPESLSDYGLDPPRARISFQDANGGEMRTVFVGLPDESPESKGLFVQVAGQQAVSIIEDPLHTLFPVSVSEWRDLRLLTRRLTDIAELHYSRGDTQLSMERSDTGSWQITAPPLESINEFAVNAFLRYIKEATGNEFMDDPAVEAALPAPEAVISLRFDNDEHSEILLYPGKEAGHYYARQDSGGIVSLEGVAVKMLLIDADTFLSMELLRFNKNDLSSFQLHFDAVDYTLVKRHGVWSAVAPAGFQLQNQSDAENLLSLFSPLKAESIVEDVADDLSIYGLDTPLFSIELGFEEQPNATSPKHRVTIGSVCPDNASERYAQCSTRAGVFTLSQEVMDKIRELMRGFKQP